MFYPIHKGHPMKGPHGFAKRLIKTLGYRDAIQECYENQWFGILGEIKTLRRQNNR